MESDSPNKFAVIGVFIVLGALLIGFAYVAYQNGEKDEPSPEKDLDNDDPLDGSEEYSSYDHSVFRGCNDEEALERVIRTVGNPEIIDTNVVSDFPFDKHVRIICEDNITITMSTVPVNGGSVSYSFRIKMNGDGKDEIRFGPEHALNKTADYMKNFLEVMDYKDPNGYSMEVSKDESNWQTWNVLVRPTYENIPLEGPALETKVDYYTGEMKVIRILNWIYAYEIKNTDINWMDTNEKILDSLDRLNFSMEFFISVDLSNSSSHTWSEYRTMDVGSDDLVFGGYHIVHGRMCIATVLEAEIESNFSVLDHSSDPLAPGPIYYNGTAYGTNTWFFDVETGKLLRWSLWNDEAGTSHDFTENLDDVDTTWYDHVIQFQDHF